MSTLDQCPSSKKSGLPVEKPLEARDVSAATGKAYWRSLDDLAGTGEFKEFLHREFPAFASELLDGSRRHFLRLMGASLALAGAASVPGCRRPDHKILAYNQDPEHIVPGKPLFYATAMPLPGGSCEGLLAETYEGRPTKLEGNPVHPVNMGRSSLMAQAAILDLYDPDRDPAVFQETSKGAVSVTAWSAFEAFAKSHFPTFDASKGAKLSFLVEKATSPSRDAVRDRILRRWPEAKWHVYDASDSGATDDGARMAFGSAMKAVYNVEKARTIVSLDRDFLGTDGSLEESRGFAAARFVPGQRAVEAKMSRIYSVESTMTLTGGQADHRLRMKPTAIPAIAAAMAAAVGARGAGAGASALRSAAPAQELTADQKAFVDAAVEDLLGTPGASIVMVGPTQPAAVHALAHAMNAALGNIGKTVEFVPLRGDAAVASVASIARLTESLNAGAVDTLVIIGGNPAYDAPADLKFAEAMKKAAHRVYLGDPNETAESTCGEGGHYLLRAHFLEIWGDVETWDGACSIIQPMIAPLFDAHGELSVLAAINGEATTDAFEIVRDTMAARLKTAKTVAGTSVTNPAFDKVWRRALHDGVLAGTTGRAMRTAPELNATGVGEAARSVATMKVSTGIDAVLSLCPKVLDGRMANNGWLQELPHQVHKISWDNPALISLATAKRLGIETDRHFNGPQYNYARVVTVNVGGRSMEVPVIAQPGMPDDTIALTLGYGRRRSGRVGQNTGFNAYTLTSTAAPRVASGAEVSITEGRKPYLLANTQDHWSMEGRALLREVDLAAWHKHGDEFDHSKDAYGQQRELNLAERIGIESHVPAERSVYTNKQREPHTYYETDENGQPMRDAKGNIIGRKNKYGRRVQQWGMTIDLATCTGCGACTVACQAENNIPIVGKMEVAKGREMHWIRVDRYYSSEKMTDAAFESPDMGVQPVACVHCESAPCEVVCPVNATVHGDEGLNEMAYNRCIGTRYCNNNCPYKVRRFNWFDYGTKQYKGGFGQVADGLSEELVPSNQNFIPPRLRPYKAEVAQMQYNPHVTVRSRGVMEKCTYCVQRINAARVETKLHDLAFIPDGYIQTACQQACPTGAITFGDIYDNESHDGAGSMVKRMRNDNRAYALLSFINTRPRTSHMLRIRNPNPRLRAPIEDPFHAHEHGDHGHDHGHDHDHSHEPKGEGHVMSLPVLSLRSGALA